MSEITVACTEMASKGLSYDDVCTMLQVEVSDELETAWNIGRVKFKQFILDHQALALGADGKTDSRLLIHLGKCYLAQGTLKDDDLDDNIVLKLNNA